MTELDVAGEYEGIVGKFKYRGSYPLVLDSCQHLVDKIKLKKDPCYISLHGSHDGTLHVTYERVVDNDNC
jgi:hypothetical protein